MVSPTDKSRPAPVPDELEWSLQSEHYRAIIEHSNDAIISKNLDGVVASWNEAATRLFGYRASDIIGQPIRRLLPADRQHEEDDILASICRGERILNWETVRQRRDGTLIPVAITVSPIRDAAGTIIGASKIVRDLGDRARAAQLATRLAQIVDSTQDAIFSCDRAGLVLTWNAGAAAVTGHAADDMIGRPVAALLAVEDRVRLMRAFQRALHRRTAAPCEATITRADGSTLALSLSLAGMRDLAGTAIGVSLVGRDVTQQKRLLADLRITSAVFDNSGEGILICDPRGSILRVNHAFTRITGQVPENLIGQSVLNFHVSRVSPDRRDAHWRELLATGHTQIEIWARRANGESYAGFLTVSRVGHKAAHTGYVAVLAEVTALRLEQERARRLSLYDGLTDLPNRHQLSERLQRSVDTSLRDGRSFAVVYLDLDDFARINSEFGRTTGDTILRTVARRLRDSLRESDSVARIGGDEFVAVTEVTEHGRRLDQVLGRLLGACAAPIILDDARQVTLTASVGVTLFPDDHTEPEVLLRHADAAMYQAKLKGKNCYQLFDPRLDGLVRSRGQLVRSLLRALEQDELALFYQPKVDSRSGAVVGFEGLLRWRAEDGTWQAPHTFQAALEDAEFCTALDLWVIRTALCQLAQWNADGWDWEVSVNISGVYLHRIDFPALLAGLLLEQPTVRPVQLQLEVLETTALADLPTVAAIIQECRQLGVRFALDDFGTGYSSLTYLQRLPVDVVKIDRSFVSAFETSGEDSLIRAVIALAAAFDREVVAEGVEQPLAVDRLREMGCFVHQGYVFARPMPALEAGPWAARQSGAARFADDANARQF